MNHSDLSIISMIHCESVNQIELDKDASPEGGEYELKRMIL